MLHTFEGVGGDRRDITEIAMGKGVVRERRDVTDSASGKAVRCGGT